MAILITPGIVLRTSNYRDHDRMLTLLTLEHGCIEVLSRGCRRPKSPLMSCSELFVCGEYNLYRSKSQYLLNNCELEDNFYPLRLSPERFSVASYMASLCRAYVREEDESSRVYALLLKGLYYLSYDKAISLRATTGAFLLLLADASGYRPRMKNCVLCGKPLNYSEQQIFDFDIEEGGLCCSSCQHTEAFLLQKEDIVWMCHIIKNDLLRLEETISAGLFHSLRQFVESRLDMPIKASKFIVSI